MRDLLQHNIFEFGFMPGQTVADFGAGSGHYTLPLAQFLGREGAVYAIDIEENALVRLKNLAEERGVSNIEVLTGDLEEVGGSNLRDGAVHGVLFANTLSKLGDKRTPIQEAGRVTRTGGRVVVVDWLHESPFAKLRSKSPDDISTESIKSLFESAGLTYERMWDAGEHHYGLVFRK